MGRTGNEKRQLYDDDLYSDFDVVEDELDEDQQTVRTSQLACRASAFTANRHDPSMRRSSEVVSGSRPFSVFDHEGHSGPPMTAIHRAGYSAERHVSRPMIWTYVAKS